VRRMAGYLALGLLVALAGFALYVRLAPSDPARWHVAPVAEGALGELVTGENSASFRLGPEAGTPAELLAALDAVALASPRTTRLAGSVEEGRITWVTRSALWGLPDFTTAEVRSDGLYVQARSRFGQRDMGVNALRLTDWLAKL
jgi:uncharacterized protein (DUF1499 family)